MIEEDSLFYEQIRKKKRFVLLTLFTLFLIGILAALSLITPTTPFSQAVAEAESKTPMLGQATPTFFVFTPIPTPTSRANATHETAPQPATTVDESAKTPDVIAEATKAAEGTQVSAEASSIVRADEWQEPNTPSPGGVEGTSLVMATATLTNSAESKKEPEESKTPTVISSEIPNTTINEPNGSPGVTSTAVAQSSVSPEENESPTSLNDEPPDAIDIGDLPRVHELWDSAKENETPTRVEARATASLTATTNLTNTSIVSETEPVIPPNGLPVTGISLRHGLNWAAVTIVVLLLGAGITTLCHSGSGQR